MKNLIVKALPLRKIVSVGLLVALGTIAAPFSIPVGVAKVYPVQHAINVLAGALLGPGAAVLAAVLTSTLRNLITGTFFSEAFSGAAGRVAFRLLKRDIALGEVAGTGLIGALVAFLLNGLVLPAWPMRFIPFVKSPGSIIGLILLRLFKNNMLNFVLALQGKRYRAYYCSE